ncbi:YitT family protein [Bacillus sp. FJAT-47783]|uniref:YitT family protein n=1 Tax=Bacillus sp. FJAT-47783 TaxID=2922712 RepID=UPI001FAB6423|nr:YitT family protein [Bacillus sp. FJAT-47783]
MRVAALKQRHTYSSMKLLELLYILVGSAIVAICYNLFLLPNYIASGGVSGISTITDALFHLEPAYVIWGINIPLLLAGYVLLGRKEIINSIIGSLFLPFIVYMTSDFPPATNDSLLGAIFGGIGVGIGIGIVYMGNGSTGGTALAAKIIHKYTNISLGKSLSLIDGCIVLVAIVVFDVQQGLYALIGVYMTSKAIDLIQSGFNRTKTSLIITDKEKEVQDAIFHQIDRGVTKLSAQGGYTNSIRPMIMCVVDQSEFAKLKNIVKKIDPKAFVVVMDSTEVLGEGFSEQ